MIIVIWMACFFVPNVHAMSETYFTGFKGTKAKGIVLASYIQGKKHSIRYAGIMCSRHPRCNVVRFRKEPNDGGQFDLLEVDASLPEVALNNSWTSYFAGK